MKLEDAPGERLNTRNKLRVDSQAVRSIDFSPKSSTLEVVFIDGEVYHYYKVPASVWNKIQEIIQSGGSVGTYVNQEFKSEVKRLDLDYRKIITD